MQSIFILAAIITFSFSSWGKSTFNDEDLGGVLRNHRQGIIYLWSPFMPLSVLGREEIIEVAKDLELDLVLLVDPLALESDTPDPILNSSQLMKHGLLDHYPAITLYDEGTLLDDVIIHGYEKKSTLTKLIQTYLDKRMP